MKGKFQNELAEQVHAVSLMGIGEEFGDVNEMGTHWTFLYIDGGLESVRNGVPPEGFYCLREDSQGFVDVTEYATEYDFNVEKSKVSEGVDAFYNE